MISMNNYELLRVQFNKTCNIFIVMLVLGHRVCVCVVGRGAGREFEVLLLIPMPLITFHLQRENSLSGLPEF